MAAVTPRPAPVPEKPKTRDELVLVDVDADGLVYQRELDRIYVLNPLAKLVFQLCDGKGTVAETASGIAEAFGVPLERVQPDVERTVRSFAVGQLFEPESGAEGPPPPQRPPEPELKRLDFEPSP
jgi:hypothetical protein